MTLSSEAKSLEDYCYSKHIKGTERVNLFRNLFENYKEKYPLCKDVMEGLTTFSKRIKSIDRAWYKKLIPWRKNDKYNEKVDELRPFVSGTSNLEATGLWKPDNFFSTALWTSIGVFGTVLTISHFFPHKSYANHEDFEQTRYFLNFIFPLKASFLLSSFLAPISNWPRFSKQPLREAKYLDSWVEKFRAYPNTENCLNTNFLEKSACENYPYKSNIKFPENKLPESTPLNFDYNKI